jgi:hypothetical protein
MSWFQMNILAAEAQLCGKLVCGRQLARQLAAN